MTMSLYKSEIDKQAKVGIDQSILQVILEYNIEFRFIIKKNIVSLRLLFWVLFGWHWQGIGTVYEYVHFVGTEHSIWRNKSPLSHVT